LLSDISFLEKIYTKTVKVTQVTLKQFITEQNIPQTKENKKAASYLGWID
jgi:hypothetical protein